jgi:hypothetical protein
MAKVLESTLGQILYAVMWTFSVDELTGEVCAVASPNCSRRYQITEDAKAPWTRLQARTSL